MQARVRLPLAERPRGKASHLLYGFRIGLTAGLSFGIAQAVVLSWPVADLMAGREWIDVLSFAAVSHALLWSLCGAVGGAGLGLLARALPRLAEAPRLAGLAWFVACAGSFFGWAVCAYLGVKPAQGVQFTWVLGIVAVASALFASVFGLGQAFAHAERKRGLNHRTLRVEQALFPVTLLVALAAGVVQWVEYPGAHENLARPDVAAPQPDREEPDVVFIVLDTQRADRIGSYGYSRPTTPFMDAFAAGARVFENCMSPGIWTVPSHASMFTGLYPSEHGCGGGHRWLDDRFDTLAEQLARRGYETMAFSNNVWVSAITNITQGFERVIRPGAILNARGTSIDMMLDRVLYRQGWVGSWIGRLTAHDEGARYTNRLIARWLDRRDREKPLFLFVNYIEPHLPYHPHHRYRELFVPEGQMEHSYRIGDTAYRRIDEYSPAEFELMNDTYDSETRMLDEYVGQLLGLLESRLDWSNTFVVITSDHGENVGDHGMRGHNDCVYQTLAHVPLIVRFPPRLQPGRSAELVQTMDLPATILDAVDGAPPEMNGHGQSLLAVPIGQQIGERLVMVERLESSEEDEGGKKGLIRSLRRGTMKYIANAERAEELYDLGSDRDETTDLAPSRPSLTREFASELARFMTGLSPYHDDAGDASTELDRASEARLRALGYVE